MRVFGVHIIFADVNDRQFPQLREVHAFVQHALAERAFAEEANSDLSRFQGFGGECGAGGNAHASRNDRVRSQIAGSGIGDVHRTAFSAAVSGFFSQQFGKHQFRRGAFGEAVAMAAMRAGDVVIGAQRFANSDRDRFFADVKVRQARHQRARVQFIYIFFKQTDRHHLAVHAQPLFHACASAWFWLRSETVVISPLRTFVPALQKPPQNPASRVPFPRAAVRNSFETAVVGSGTSSARPISRASSMSFCIMFTSNHASAGMVRTNGPRYLIIGDATALLVSTSTATSRAMPLFSASNTPSQNAIICTARLRFVAIFIDKRQAVVADVSHFRSDVVQDRFQALECLAASAHHHRKLSFLQSDHAAGNRRVNHVRALFASLGGDAAAVVRTHRAHIDQKFPRRNCTQNSVGSFHHRGQGLFVRHHRKCDVRRGAHCARRLAPLHSLLDQPFRFGARAVVPRDGVSFAQQTAYHLAAHHAQPDKT